MSNDQKRRWTPPNEVSKKEVVGRRAFGSRVFEKEKGPFRLRYKINVFLDSKDGDLSVDRLGVRHVEEDVLQFLYPLCNAIAAKGNTKFQGWAQFLVSDLPMRVTKTESIGENNPYHAEIDRSNHRSEEAQRSFAFELCVYASKYEFVSSPAT